MYLGSCVVQNGLILVLLFVVVATLRVAETGGEHGCGMRLLNMYREVNSLMTLSWVNMHVLGARNFAELQRWVMPGYGNVVYAAGAHRTGERRVALTIDDFGLLNVAAFEATLSLLQQEGVHATLFVVLDPANTEWTRWESAIRLAVAQGHEIGNHGFSDHHMTDMTRAEILAAIENWERTMKSVVPQWPLQQDWKWFRPPWGMMNSNMASVLDDLGYKVSLPDIWSDDTGINNARFHSSVIVNAACDGSVILLHAPDRPSTEQAFTIIRDGIAALRVRRKLDFVRLTELFSEQAPGGPSCNTCPACVVLIALMICIALCSFALAFFESMITLGAVAYSSCGRASKVRCSTDAPHSKELEYADASHSKQLEYV